MGDRIIRRADIGGIESRLNGLANNIQHVSGQVEYVSGQVDHVNSEVFEMKMTLDSLIEEFQEFVRQDQLAKNIQLAETRIVKVRQELENNFGHYGEIRRRVTGILQAVDVSLVKKETIENATEEHMLAAPRYWLAPCLIALSAWLNDNQELANKAMQEALRRDDEKTSLFFALVTRRGARYKASREWLDRYFGLQDPHDLEREIIILIDGFANGVFGPDARMKCGKQIEAWIEELSQKVGFVEEQHAQWKTALESKIQRVENSYVYLRKHSPTWPQLEKSLEGAKLHQIIQDYFQGIFTKDITPAKNITYAVDALLDTLVSKFDDEELPLRKEERRLSLIIQEDGDRDYAQKLFDNEKILEERVPFTQLLTNFAMYPEVSNASLATQKFSIALSKEWIKFAHDDITAENRASVPIDIELSIDQWKGVTRDGANEQELVHSIENHIETRREKAIASVKLTAKHWASLVGAILFGILGIGTTFFFIFTILCGWYFYNGKKQLQKRKDSINEEYAVLLEYCKQELRAALAEVVDWRREYAKEDQKAILVTTLLESITPEQYTFSSHDTARTIVK